jgi:prepilin-type N-terminal cleavage/methylation domain-containing protein
MKITKLHSRKTGLRGFALTEVLLAIAVIVIIGIAAYPLYKNARTSSEVEAMANDIAVIQTNTQTLFSGQSSYAGLNMDLLNTAGMVPDDLRGDDGGTPPVSTYTNSWGGDVTIAATGASDPLPQNAGFTIILTKVPKSACTQLVARVAPSFLAIGTSSQKDVMKTVTGKVDVAQTATSCNNVGAGASLAFTAR